jgi:hypothetical protein
MRPDTPLAVENSVGKPAAEQAPNAGMGKRAWPGLEKNGTVRFRLGGISQTKDAERRDKVSVRTGKDTGSRQDL